MKIIVIFLFFINTLIADDLYTIEILKSKSDINFENIKENKNFKKVSNTIIIQNDSNDYWLKVNFNNKIFENKKYLFILTPLFDLNHIVFDKHLNLSFIEKNTFELNNNLTQPLYLKIVNKKNLIYLKMQLEEQKKYLTFKSLKDKLYGLSYGIIFTAFLYYLLFYLYSRNRINLYYSLTQLFSMLILIFSQNTTYFKYDFISLGFIIFSLLFTKEFLQTKKYTPKINTIFNFLIPLFIFNTFFNLEEIFPISIFMILYPISAVIIYKKTKREPIKFYLLAWGIVIVALIFITIEVFIKSLFGVYIDFMSVLHIILPLESLILAFALSYSLKVIEDEKNEKEKLLIHQNKLASIGEMINNIAHQWRQPLTHLSYVFMNLNKAYEHKKLTKEYLENKTNEATNQLKYMSKTIDIFKDFYTPHVENKKISVKEEINNALQIVSSSFEKERITINIIGEDFNIYGPNGELSQVIMNILTNAKDALVSNNIKEPSIKIRLEKNSIYIQDNALGIDNETSNKMFTPYFSTKKYGSGIGLYMSKLIIEKHFNGTISHRNKENGSLFIVRL